MAQLGDKGTIYRCRTCCQNSDGNFDYAAALGRLNVAARQAQKEKSVKVFELAATSKNRNDVYRCKSSKE